MVNRKNVVAYPVILRPDVAGTYNVEIPDVHNARVLAYSVKDGLAQAAQLIGRLLAGEDTFPAPTSLDQLHVGENDLKLLVSVDMSTFQAELAN